MTDDLEDLKKKAGEGMTFARADEHPVIEVVARLAGDTAGFIATEVLKDLPPAARDMILGSIQLKLAMTILRAGSGNITRERLMQMVEFYLDLIDREMLRAEKEEAGGVQ